MVIYIHADIDIFKHMCYNYRSNLRVYKRWRPHIETEQPL